MDSWYASKRLLLYIESLLKTYYCPMKSNRLVDASEGEKPYQRIDALHWKVSEETTGKVVKLHKFPKHHKVKVFRVASSRRTDYVVTNDLSQSDVSATRQACIRVFLTPKTSLQSVSPRVALHFFTTLSTKQENTILTKPFKYVTMDISAVLLNSSFPSTHSSNR